MLNNRECVGTTEELNWQEAAFGKGKYRRKTIGFGDFNKKAKSYSGLEINIRELSIIEGGIGCAVWDAAIILSRWIYNNKEVFNNKKVLELGSGVGLPGLVAAYFSQEVALTDYIDQLIDNLEYNISINQETEDGGEFKTKDISTNTTVAKLDWHDMENPSKPIEVADIILGSELTYNLMNVEVLIKVLERFLKPDGVFYEVLSDDRDGVSTFLDGIKAAGWEVDIFPVPEMYLGNYGTKQRQETYKFYTFKRPGATCALMK